MEEASLQALIPILQNSMEGTDKILKLRVDLKTHTETLDDWRGESFSSVFPELSELWR